MSISPFVSPAVVTFVKFLMIAGGLGGSVLAVVMIARRVSTENVFARVVPHLLLVAAMWVGYLLIFTGATGAPAAAAPVPGAPPAATAPAPLPVR